MPEAAPAVRPILADPATMRAAIRDAVAKAVRARFPIRGRRYTAELTRLEVKEADVSPERQKELRLSGGNAFETVIADIAVKDAEGHLVTALANHRLLNIPWYTPRHTLLLDGNEYAVVNQMRTKPGIYTRKRGNEELESAVNLSKGANFKVIMDPATGVFTIELLGARLPAFAVLRILGAGHTDLLAALGNELYDANAGISPARMDRVRATLYDKLIRRRAEGAAPDAGEMEARIRAYFAGTAIDPETTKITLGTAYRSISARALLDAMRKILAVYRGEEDIDERDHLEFQQILGPEDLLQEVIDKAPELTEKLRARLDALGDKPAPAEIRAVFSPALFTKPLRSFITSSSLSRLPTQTNPVEFADTASIITRLGEGAISSERAVPFETRGVHASYLGLIDPIAAPESSKVGIDARAARSAMKGTDNEFYRRLRDCRTGRIQAVRAIETFDKRVGFPDALHVTERKPGDLVPAVYKGALVKVPRRDLDYQIPSPHDLFTATTNTLPLANANQGNRLVMGDKHVQQALPLREAETRLVKPVMRDAPGGGTLRSLAEPTIPRSPVDGVVTEIADGRIAVKAKNNGEVSRVDFATWLPLAGKTFLHNTPMVKPGDAVKAGQALADSNFSRDGELAMGRNLTVAYMPYMGLNHEDGIVLSQSAAEKMTSVHAVTVSLRLDKNVSTGRERYAAAFPTAFSEAQLGKLDEDGAAREGAVLEQGDPVILALEDNGGSRVNQVLGLLHKSLTHPWRDAARIWEEHYPGQVVAAHKGHGKIVVVLKMEKPLEQGDKLAGSFGNKGVCSKILPDDHMPRDEAGTPVDAVFTSAGVISRINPAQILESALGKAAKKRGKPYEIESFSLPDYVSFVKEELRKNEVKDKETLTDPLTGKHLPGVFVGVQHCHKLFKTSGTNYSARGIEGPHDQDESPTGSGDSGPKALGGMEVNALLAHNARALLREGTALRGSKNAEFWRAFQDGRPPDFPARKKTFDRFTAILRQAGINIDRRGDELAAGPLTDRDILALSAGEIRDAKRLKAKTLEPEDGGLFDPAVTGGLKGERWSHVALAEPVINPVFGDAARTLLGLSGAGLREAYAKEGGQALRDRLNAIDVGRELEKQEAALNGGGLTRAALDAAVKKVKLLRALKEQGLKPGEAYTLSVAPVTPPVVRPVVIGRSGDIMDNDANHLYRDLILTNNSVKKVRDAGLGDDVLRESRLALADRMSELAGMIAPSSPHMRGRGVKGALEMIAGDTPKQGYFQRKVIYNKTNLSGRATITPDVSLGLDEVGLSEQAAWEMYKPFVIRGLAQLGYSPLRAREAVAARTPAARDLLSRELEKRPVIINRAPTLWRHGIMAAKPLLRPGNNLHVNSLWEKSLNADYDGDAMQIHLPVTDEAVDEAKRMFPSRQLFSDKKPGDLLQMPTREPIIGLYKATANVGRPAEKAPVRRFADEAEAWRAYYAGTLKMTDYVEISGLSAAAVTQS